MKHKKHKSPRYPKAYEFVRLSDMASNVQLQFNPSHVHDIESLAFCLTTDTSGEREPFVEGCKRLAADELASLCDIVHGRQSEYDGFQERHLDDIRRLKDEIASLWRAGHNRIRPGNIHVVSEIPLLYRATLVSGNGDVNFTRAGTAEQLLNLIRSDSVGDSGMYEPTGYTELAEEGTCPTCPVCGSPWQLINFLPVIHCCRCDTDWVHFTRRVLSRSDCLDPGGISSLPGNTEEYLDGEPDMSSPGLVDTLLGIIGSVPGSKVVELQYGDGRGVEDSITFQHRDGNCEDSRHFMECLDFALKKAGFSRESYRECPVTVSVMIYVPDCPDVDLDAFEESIDGGNQLPCTMYAMAAGDGMFRSAGRELVQKMIEGTGMENAVPGNLGDFYPGLSEGIPVAGKQGESGGKPGRVVN